MNNLKVLDNVTRISAHVVRVLGQNPGKFTLQGTNTYLIGLQNPYILVDTAQGFPAYIPVLSSAFDSIAKPSNPALPDVSDIILSHWHIDHVGGIGDVLKLLKDLWVSRNPGLPYSPPRLHKYPISEPGAAISTSTSTSTSTTPLIPPALCTPTSDGSVFHDLKDDQLFRDSTGTTLFRVIYTPGHTVDSICLLLPHDRALYTSDTVLGQGTSVFENLTTYLASLQRLLDLGKDDDPISDYHVLYPGHGAVVENGRETIADYIQHRLEREKQILRVLESSVPKEWLGRYPDNEWSTWNIVRVVYKDYPEDLWLAASRGVELHLLKLKEDEVVVDIEGEGPQKRWKLLKNHDR